MPSRRLLPALAAACLLPLPAQALEPASYNATVHDRFSSGFSSNSTSNPIPNTDPAFIAAGYDLSPVGWSATYIAFQVPLVTPRHILIARHISETDGIHTYNFFGGDNATHAYQKTAEFVTGAGPQAIPGRPDINVGLFPQRFDPAHRITPFPLWDDTPAFGDTLFLAGRGGNTPNNLTSATSPRFATAPFYAADPATDRMDTDNAALNLVVGDSNGPLMKAWTLPDGTPGFALLGFHSATTNSTNVHSWAADDTAAGAINNVTVSDGHCLRWVDDPDRLWEGVNATWTAGWNGTAPGNGSYAGFDSDSAATTTIDLSGNRSLRGLSFAPGANGTFTFTNGTLTLGRGGLANYDPGDSPSFDTGITLSDHQHWSANGAGFTHNGSLNTNGRLLVFSGAGNHSLSGPVTGSGALTIDTDGTVSLSGNNSYQGDTTACYGTLLAASPYGNSAGSGGLHIETFGTVRTAANETLHDTAPVLLDGGTLDLGGFSETTGNLTLFNGTLTNGTLTPASAALFTGNINASLSGNFLVEKSGNGTVLFSQPQPATGNFLLHAGTARFAPGSSAAFTLLHLSPNATLAIDPGHSLTLGPSQTLSGNGTLTGNLALDGSLSPGNSTGTLTFANGTLTLTANATTLLDLGNASDLLAFANATAALDGTLALTPGPGFAPNAMYTLCSGLDSPPAGNFTAVSGQPAHYAPRFAFASGNYTLTFLSPYQQWQEARFTNNEILNGDADPAANPDGDQLPNLEEFAFNRLPKAFDSTPVFNYNVIDSGGNITFTLEFTRDTTLTDITYRIDSSPTPDFASFTEICAASGPATPTGSGFVSETPGTLRTVTVQETLPIASESASAFYRLRITRP